MATGLGSRVGEGPILADIRTDDVARHARGLRVPGIAGTLFRAERRAEPEREWTMADAEGTGRVNLVASADPADRADAADRTDSTDRSAPGRAGAGAPTEPRRPSGGIARAVRLLDLIVAEGPLRFAELEELSELPKATLHRLLNELAEERLARFDERGLTWSAGFRILEMANRIWTRSDIRHLARDQLLALAALSGETVQIAVLADTHAVVIDHVESVQSVRHSTAVGNRSPVYCSGSGKVLLAWCNARRQREIIGRISFARTAPNTITDRTALLAELARISERGYAVDDEEHYPGTRCIAAPVVDADGGAIAGLSITAPAFRVGIRQLERWRADLLAAAAEISRRLAPHSGAEPAPERGRRRGAH